MGDLEVDMSHSQGSLRVGTNTGPRHLPTAGSGS
jgi:hypothetical protein